MAFRPILLNEHGTLEFQCQKLLAFYYPVLRFCKMFYSVESSFFEFLLYLQKIIGQRGRLLIQALGYLSSQSFGRECVSWKVLTNLIQHVSDLLKYRPLLAFHSVTQFLVNRRLGPFFLSRQSSVKSKAKDYSCKPSNNFSTLVFDLSWPTPRLSVSPPIFSWSYLFSHVRAT